MFEFSFDFTRFSIGLILLYYNMQGVFLSEVGFKMFRIGITL